MKHYELWIRPLDPMFFRDGRPFDAGSYTWAESLAMPYPSVLWGAIFSMMGARKLVNFKENEWDRLRITDYFLYDAKFERELVPAPLDLFSPKAGKGDHFKHEKYTPNIVASSLGPKHLDFLVLPDEDSEDMVDASQDWIARGDWDSYAGQEGQVRHFDREAWWSQNLKIGIKRSNQRLSAEEGMLYRADHLEWEQQLRIGVRIETDVEMPASGLLKLGGEGKMAQFECREYRPHAPKPIPASTEYFKLYFQSPAFFASGNGLEELAELGERMGAPLQSACVGKPLWVGGFDLAERRPKPLRKALPPGSVFLFEAPERLAAHDWANFRADFLRALQSAFGTEQKQAADDARKGFGIAHLIVGQMKNSPKNAKGIYEEESYFYAMASTLNQMVNYIPLKLQRQGKLKGISFTSEILNITLTNDDRKKTHENDLWDKNWKAAVAKEDFPEVKDITIAQSQWLKHQEMVIELKKQVHQIAGDRPIFWNITGGQRPYLMAVMEIVKERRQDVTAYVEGNSGQMVLGGGGRPQPIAIEPDETFNIPTALRLMGFEDMGNNDSQIDHDKHLEIIKKYKENADFRSALVKTNKKDGPSFEDVMSKNGFADLANTYKNQRFPFGYLLEGMVEAMIRHELSGKLADIRRSVTIRNDKENEQFDKDDKNEPIGKDKKNKQSDEFDILCLTKTGRVICFECKSGAMSGDVAKSTRYSTYAIAGVYGMPILITPLLEDELEHSKKIKGDEYKAILASVRAAFRANMEVWGVDKVTELLSSKLKEKIQL